MEGFHLLSFQIEDSLRNRETGNRSNNDKRHKTPNANGFEKKKTS